MRKLESLQVGRGVAVLSVLVFHLGALSREYQRGLFYYPAVQILRAGVDVFFVISGVVMVVTTYSRLGQAGTGNRFLIHRVSRIYPPYLFLTALLTVFWMFHPEAVNSHSGGVDIFASYTLWPSPGKLPLVQVGWTLSFEMMFYLVFFFIISYASKAWLPRALVLWSLVVVIGSAVIASDTSGVILKVFPRAAFFFCPYVLEFVAGCFIGLATLKIKLGAGKTSVIFAVSLFALQAAAFQAINYDAEIPVALRVLLFGPPAVFFVYGLLAWEGKKGWLKAPRWMVRCGDMSYSIYLVHLLVLHFTFRYVWPAFNHTGMRTMFLVFATTVAVVASVIFYKLIERPLSLWTRLRLEDVFKVQARIAAASPSVETSPEALIVKG
jgi:exopolysaccharide production protein ExoZ